MNILFLTAGVACSALAQIALKYSARFDAWGGRWLLVMAAAAAMYGASFLIYSFLLRKEDLSRISPLMTSAVAFIVVLAGTLLFGETMTARRGIGIVLGMAAIFLLAK
ncbi:MAG TPA: EamA family transporter [Rectinemataceae bacterium]|nr:EamA family transporter [Rectinemataceae bacterium]